MAAWAAILGLSCGVTLIGSAEEVTRDYSRQAEALRQQQLQTVQNYARPMMERLPPVPAHSPLQFQPQNVPQYPPRFERLPPVEPQVSWTLPPSEVQRLPPVVGSQQQHYGTPSAASRSWMPPTHFASAGNGGSAPAEDLKFPKLEEGIVSQPPYEPRSDCNTYPSNYFDQDFAPTPTFPCEPYDAAGEEDTYGGKSLVRTQHPWAEWFRPFYGPGPIPPSPHWFGFTNPATPQFLVYGDYRAAMAYIEPGAGASFGKLANRLNLELDLKLTATERIHAFVDPFTNGTTFSGVEVQNGDIDFINGLNGNFQTLFFEGDLGAITGGAIGVDPPFDLPFTVGRIPLLLQNGIWMEDNLLGAAFAIPARNSAALDWSNFDVTFFAAIDEVTSPAFGQDDSVAHVFGSHAFIEAYDGYLEVGYAYLDDHTGQGLGYHNLGISFQRRYFNAVSNALRCIVNAGQDPISGQQTANGALFIVENVFITESPYYKLPYANFFLGLDRPQSVARNANAQGVLRNTGINFESDNLTNYPTLDATGNDVYGAAIGLDLLGEGFSQQLIVEAAVLQVLGDDPLRNAKGDQYALGVRYQLPLSNSWIFRTDAMYGLRENDSNISGARVELRHKF